MLHRRLRSPATPLSQNVQQQIVRMRQMDMTMSMRSIDCVLLCGESPCKASRGRSKFRDYGESEKIGEVGIDGGRAHLGTGSKEFGVAVGKLGPVETFKAEQDEFVEEGEASCEDVSLIGDAIDDDCEDIMQEDTCCDETKYEEASPADSGFDEQLQDEACPEESHYEDAQERIEDVDLQQTNTTEPEHILEEIKEPRSPRQQESELWPGFVNMHHVGRHGPFITDCAPEKRCNCLTHQRREAQRRASVADSHTRARSRSSVSKSRSMSSVSPQTTRSAYKTVEQVSSSPPPMPADARQRIMFSTRAFVRSLSQKHPSKIPRLSCTVRNEQSGSSESESASEELRKTEWLHTRRKMGIPVAMARNVR